MLSQQFALTPGQSRRDIALYFRAQTAIVDNPTTQAWQIGNVIVAPYVVNAVVKLESATPTPKVLAFTPPGYTIAVVAGQQATVQFTDLPLDASAGFPYAPNILTVTTVALPDAQRNVAYQAVLLAVGGTGAYTWTITAGALPAGLALAAATGAITGTPTTTGLSSFTVTVTDAAGLTASKALSIRVLAGVPVAFTYAPANIAGVVGFGIANFAAVAVPAGTQRRITAFGANIVAYTAATASPTITLTYSLMKNAAIVANGAVTLQGNQVGGGLTACDVIYVAGDTLNIIASPAPLAGGGVVTLSATASGTDTPI